MTTSIAGLGIVSPFGMTAQDHALFVRADAASPPPSPFVDANGERLEVAYCPWLGARLDVVQRMVLMAQIALQDALEEWQTALGETPGDATLFLCTPAPRVGLDQKALELLVTSMRATQHIARVVPLQGAAAAFVAVQQASELNARGHAAVILGLDSFVSVATLTEVVRRPPHHWSDAIKLCSEASAAILLLPQAEARRLKLDVATVHGAAFAASGSHDDNDDPVDGTAMAQVLRTLPAVGPISMAYGQDQLDPLRRSAWHLATARNAARFAEELHFETIEGELGRVGAAAGALNLAYGAAVVRHRAMEPGFAHNQPFVAWAISRDGTRGAAIVTGTA